MSRPEAGAHDEDRARGDVRPRAPRGVPGAGIMRSIVRKAPSAKAKGDRPRRPAPRREGAAPIVRALAWGVHLYTAMGLVAAAGIAVLLARGGPGAFRGSFALMLIATIIDATDGTLARRVRVKEVLPQFDGRKLDDLTDFLTYTFLPLLLLWRAEVLPAGQQGWLLLPLLASAYGFCQAEAKTGDGYFLGFPSLWNVVAFYLYVLRLPGWLALTIVAALALLTFVPSRYLYPTQRGPLNALSNLLGIAWACLLAWVLLRMPPGRGPIDHATWSVAILSLYYPIFYMAASWAITLRGWRARPR